MRVMVGKRMLECCQIETSWEEDSTQETDYQNKIDKISDLLAPGDYLFSWNCEYKLDNGELACAATVMIEINDVEYALDNWKIEYWHHWNGSVHLICAEEETPNIKLKYKVTGAGGDTVRIRRARISIMKIRCD